MIRIGNILINPEDISSVHEEIRYTSDTKMRGVQTIQIIYKNGVVKNFTSSEIGMSYSDFIRVLIERQEKQESDKIFRMMAALKSINNE